MSTAENETGCTERREEVGQREIARTAGGNGNWYTHFGRVWWFLKLNMHPPYGPAIPRAKKTCIHTRAFTHRAQRLCS